MASGDPGNLGRKIKQLRARAGLTQAQLAQRLAISASYLNLIENERRPLPANLLLQIAAELGADLGAFQAAADPKLAADLAEVFGDPLFEDHPVDAAEIRELASAGGAVARAILELYHAYQAARGSAQVLVEQLSDPSETGGGIDRVRLSSEQVSDFIQRRQNFFPELEAAADAIVAEAALDRDELFASLAAYLGAKHGVRVRVERVGNMGGALRRFDPGRRELILSEVLRRGSRNFQLAHQVGLLACSDVLAALASDPLLATDESKALGRVALANYFASAVLMPYDAFLAAAKDVRYDVELLGHRFRASYEQVCHRLTTLRKKGKEGVAFHMIRVDIAGNISKKFSATGVRFPRFSGLCPLWNEHHAFLRPGFIRVQLSRLPDGTSFFSVARTITKHRGGWHAPAVLTCIGIGCSLEDAHKLVYADGIDLGNAGAAVPIGTTCRLCDRLDCEARALPPLQRPLKIDENVLGVSFYAPLAVEGEGRGPRPDS